MKGFVPTPSSLVDMMVDKLFSAGPPTTSSTVLDPGCGAGPFIAGVLRWCHRTGAPVPEITGIDSDPVLLGQAKVNLAGVGRVTLVLEDFLTARGEKFDYIVGNPPYVPITGLDSVERTRYRQLYRSASGRFDLYLLFFEQALSMLKPGGRLVFVTPEKFVYVQSAAALRQQLAATGVEEIEFVDEATFPGLVTYPVVTTVAHPRRDAQTRVITRDRTTRQVALDASGGSWLPAISGSSQASTRYTLLDAFERISCGVATGADGTFILRKEDALPGLQDFCYPTISGRELNVGDEVRTKHVMLVPYKQSGELIPEEQLGPLGEYLSDAARRARLVARTCVARKPWYAFHETPPLGDILRPKILCKDIGPRPWFAVDEEGEIVPRHSVYYLVPKDPDRLRDLCDYLNSAEVCQYLMANCQRAANGFVRLQSHVLKSVPLPGHFVTIEQPVLA